MNIIFLGTPEFAIPALKAIYNEKQHKILAVVCQPDKPSLRGKKVVFSPVKQFGIEHNIPVYQFNKIRIDGVEKLKNLNPDIMVTCAYGQILSQEIIDIPKYGIVNIHGSLLPKYRGSSPIQWSLINGEKETGITIAQTEKGLDTGDILLQEKLVIDENDNSETLFNKLSILGSELILKALDKIENNTITRIPQNNDEASYFPMIKKEDSLINFNETTNTIINKIKGYYTWPTAYFMYKEIPIKIFNAKNIILDINKNYKNGEIVFSDRKNGFVIKTLDGFLNILEIQVPNSKKLNIKDYLNGKSFEVGYIIE